MEITGTQICAGSDVQALARTRFFARQLVTPDDLTQDQVYFREKMRRHNRMLHGWGVVAGASCAKGPEDCEITIQPGYIIGPYGDEIMIDREVTINVCHQDLDGNSAGPCGQPGDPWCTDVRVDRLAGQKLYVAVSYAECQDRPVRASVGGNGCATGDCEYSRVREGYAIRVLTKLPAGYSDPMSGPDVKTAWQCGPAEPSLPACPPEPWVVLADVTMASDGKIGSVDPLAHRRYVASFGNYYFACSAAGAGAEPLQVTMVRFIGSTGESAFLKNPSAVISMPQAFGAPNATIEVHFAGGKVKPETVVSGKSFLVDAGAGPIDGSITPLAEMNAVSWRSNLPLDPGTYRFALLGNGADAVQSDANTALDGEASQLPSGNGKPGGDFTFSFTIEPA